MNARVHPLASGRRGRRPGRPGPSWRPALEVLEDRTLLSAKLVLNGPQTLVPLPDLSVNSAATVDKSEMTIAVNPANPLNVAGFSHYIKPSYDYSQIAVFYSLDGGATWSTTLIGGTGSVDNDGQGSASTFIRFDPTITFDDDGNLYVAYGASNQFTNTKLIVGKSTDGGASFANADFRLVDTGPGYGGVDKFYLSTGPAGPGTTTQAVYVAYERNDSTGQPIMVAGSNDGGDTFTTPTAIDTFGGGSFFAGPGVGPDGELYVVWQSTTDRKIKSRVKPDGLWGSGPWDPTTAVKNLNQGLTQFSVPPQPRRGIYNTPSLDVDRSGGAHNGRAYVTWVDRIAGTNTEVFLSWSDDNGATWSSTGTTGNVEDGPGSAFHSWVAVDQASGSVNVLYRTNDGAPNTQEALTRVASSLDGGLTFTKATLSSQDSKVNVATYTGDFLDYTGFDVRDGTLHGLWSDNRGATPGSFSTNLAAYTAAGAYRSDTGTNVLVVRGDDAGMTDDTIVLRRSPANADFLEVLVNGRTEYAGLAQSVNYVTINGEGGNNRIVLQDLIPGIQVRVRGGSGNNTLVAPDMDNTWVITGQNAGYLDNAVQFFAVQNLVGGAGADTFRLHDGQGVDGTIDGGGGTNTLDYSRYTGNVLVNLQTGAATGVGGGVVHIQNVIGGNGPGYNILVGNGGNVLTGGLNTRNLLIAGASASTLVGGNDDDILIGGTTAYDTDMASLMAIMAYWTGPDDYATRVANLTSGNGVPLLDASTVTSNGGGNTLTGGLGLDLYYGSLANDTYDWNPMTETFISI
jgi:hypothetical protein